MKKLRRFRSSFLPIHTPPPGERLVIAIEKLVKGGLFRCSMCGNCILQETAFICPMLCPKGLRNGPCGSGSSEACCVEPNLPCVWHVIYEHAEKLGRLEYLMEVQAPLDWSRVGRETWGTVLAKARRLGLISPRMVFRRPVWRDQFQRMLLDIRHPDWWQGDDRYHPPGSYRTGSELQAALARGEFVVTTEIAPPLAADASIVMKKAARLKRIIHFANVTQNPMAKSRMSSLASSILLLRCGIEPVLQVTARDYNRNALQSEALGAASLGIHNIVCLTGDPPTAGRGPAGYLPYDLDATQMLWILRRMRDDSRFLDGRELSAPPNLFLGAAGSPNDPNLLHEALRMEKKINAGAQFIQTQLIYKIEALQRWLEALDKRKLLEKVHILVGVGPLRSLKVARYIQEHIPDVVIPVHFVERMEHSSDPEQTGLEIALEVIQEIRDIPSVSGIHLMSVGWESILPRLIEEAGLAARVLD